MDEFLKIAGIVSSFLFMIGIIAALIVINFPEWITKNKLTEEELVKIRNSLNDPSSSSKMIGYALSNPDKYYGTPLYGLNEENE